MGWFGVRRASPRPDALLREDDALGIVELLAVLDEALAHVGRAETLIERCSTGATLGVSDARAGLALRVRFTQLSHWVEGMPCPDDLLLLRERAACLLRYYLLMVTSAIDAAFAPAGRRQIAIRGSASRAGMPPAQALAALRDELREAAA
jgi:hypothetical protein